MGSASTATAPRVPTSTARRAGLIVFVVVYALCVVAPVEQRTDSVWVIHTATSVLQDGDGDIDEYQQAIDAANGWKVLTIDEHQYYDYPTGVILLAAPLVAVAHIVDPDLDQALLDGAVPVHERALASLFVAGTALLLYALALRAIRRVGPAVAVALVFAFCTAAWSVASRALWQHGPSMFLLCLVLFLADGARRRPSLIVWAGPVAVMAYFTRPTNLVVPALLVGYALVRHRDQLIKLIPAMALTGAAVLVLNTVLYGDALPPYFESRMVDVGRSNPFVAVAGNLVSPSRGLLVFSPVLLFVPVGIWLKARAKSLDWLDAYVGGVIVGEYLAVSILAPVWWSGWSFGQRFLADLLPYLFWFLIPVFAAAWPSAGTERSPRTAALQVVLGVTVLFSFFVHARGATDQDTFDWNRVPVDVHLDDDRIWDWGDLQFMRGL